jgi:cysteinyl-tRNA synthetase
MDGRAPYKALLTHGFVVDGKGLKMSKSKGNVIAPQKIADTLGAEILRLWVAATDYSGELSISDEILKRVVESLPPHPQHAALPARQHRPTSTLAATCRKSSNGWRSTATRWP